MLERRNLLTGLLAAGFVGPAVVRYGSIMPVKLFKPIKTGWHIDQASEHFYIAVSYYNKFGCKYKFASNTRFGAYLDVRNFKL